MNFEYILNEVKKYYKKFDREVKFHRIPRNLIESITVAKRTNKNPIIAEIKFCSPKGKIRDYENVENIASDYISSGVCGISVLTERKFFCGDISHLKIVSKISNVPVLRKDFIFDKSQILESYYYGADTVLIISSFFNENDLKNLIETSRRFLMEPVIEVHNEDDIDRAMNCYPKIFLINNRDKDTLEIDLRRTEKLSKYIRKYDRDVIIISASGISSIYDLKYVLKYADAALIGTRFMKEKNIRDIVKRFVFSTE